MENSKTRVAQGFQCVCPLLFPQFPYCSRNSNHRGDKGLEGNFPYCSHPPCLPNKPQLEVIKLPFFCVDKGVVGNSSRNRPGMPCWRGVYDSRNSVEHWEQLA